mgnify:FL=1
MFSKNRCYQSGFTLIEIIITILLLGIMAVVSLTVMNAFKLKAEQSALVLTEQLNASSCMERIKAVSKLNYGSMKEIERIQDIVAQECPGNPTVEFHGATFKNVTDSDGNISTTVTANEKAGTCYATSIFCLVTVKINATELNYVFSNNVY